jgi:DNA (cytosine-5)-methyltransferase 1
MKPIAFKVRTQGRYTGVNGGDIKKGGGGAGAIWYEDKTFTIATHQDQWLCVSMPIISPAITTCKGSRGGSSDEAIEEIKSVFNAQKELPNQAYQYITPQMNPSTKPLRYLSVCSGMEAATVAWHHMGWTPVGFSEIEPFPSQILKHHYPTITNYGDITKFKQWPIERGGIDLLIGGTPCQSFSQAGKRAGLNDPRGQLMLSFLDLAEKLKPEWIIWENVPGVLSSGQPKGSDFGCFLQGLVKRGYGFAYRVLDAQYVGRSGGKNVPQRRRRVFVVGHLGDWKPAAEVLSLAQGLSGYIEKGNKKRKGTTTDAGTSTKTGGQLFDMQAIGQYGDKGIASTCKERDYKDATDLVVPTVLDRAAFNQGQNAQYEPLIEQTETCPTLVGRGPHAVQMPKIIKTSELRLSGKITEQEICPTLTAGAKGGDSEPLAITFQPGNLRRDAGADPSTQATTTLKATPGDQMPHIAYAQGVDLYNQAMTGDIHCPLRTNGHGHGAPAVMAFDAFNQTVSTTSQTLSCSASDVNHTGAVYSPTMAVRRLTPVECERLQGFPDNYSQIPWKGKPAEQCPDGPRYKACGNSMAVPVMRFIGEQIKKYIDGTLNK